MSANSISTQSLRIFAVTLCLVMLASCSPAPDQTQSEPAETPDKLTAAEAKAIAKEAYIFNYPLVMYYGNMYMRAIDPQSKIYSGGFGKWVHMGMSSPKDTDIVAPNNDTPYSWAWVDLRAEPWVLTMPKIEENRFYTSQWDDLWGFVVGNAGSVDDGNGGVSVLLASPTWKGNCRRV